MTYIELDDAQANNPTPCYTPSRNLVDFSIAGFNFYDGAEVVMKLAPGIELDLVSEPNNPYDPDAIALYFEGRKLGYVPQDKNALFSRLMFFGYAEILEARVIQVDPTAYPAKQVRAVVKIKDAR